MNAQAWFAWIDAWMNRVAAFIEANKTLLIAVFLLGAAGRVFKIRLNLGGGK